MNVNFHHFELLCGADRKQRKASVSTLSCTLHRGSREGNPVPVEVSNSPSWPAFDQHEQEIPSCISFVCGGCVHNASKCW